MENNRLNLELIEKISNLKNNIKELQNFFFNLYNIEKAKNNNKLIYFKRNIDKVSKIREYLDNFDLKEVPFKSEEEEAFKLYSNILNDMKKLNEVILDQQRKENISSSIKDQKRKRNLDNLKMAYVGVKSLDLDVPLNNKDLKGVLKHG